MESSRSSTQTMTSSSSNIVQTFVEIPFVQASEMTIDLLVEKTDVHNFFRILQSTFPTLQSTVEMEASRFYNQAMMSSSSNIVQTFV